MAGSILQFLAFWAFISLHFGPCGPSFPCILALWAVAFWPCGPLFPFILVFSGSASGPPPPQVAKNGPFAQRPYNGFISAVTGSILQFLTFWAFISLHFGPSFPCISALWAFISLHFGLVGLHFLAFWPCGHSFRCILALWAFISFHFGLVGLYFLAFWLCGPLFPFILAFSGSASGVRPTSCQKWPVCPTSLQWIYQRRDRLHFAVSSLLGLHFLAFWPCGPSFPCILAFSGSASGVLPPPPHKLQKMACLPNVLTMDLSAP